MSDNGHREMISFGAGVNSVAMTIMLVNEGWRGPIVFADPGAEHPDTYCYIEYFEREWLRPRGLEVIRISPMSEPELYGSRYRGKALEQLCYDLQIVPLIVSRWCTAEYKRKPLTKWARQNGIANTLLGIALEERHRSDRENQRGITLEFPLIDRNIDRAQCKRIIADHDLAVPPKSGCWFCPFQRINEWRALYDLRPDLFARAVEMEEHAAQKDGVRLPLLAIKYNLSLSMIRHQWDAQLELPLMPEPEYEYQMCECRL